MKNIYEVDLLPEEAFEDASFQRSVLNKLSVSPDDFYVKPLRRSIDARGRKVIVKLQVELFPKGSISPAIEYRKDYPDVSKALPV
ncbi:MAG: FAD-binding protein, partial [Flammeovirgaceae bacterium]